MTTRITRTAGHLAIVAMALVLWVAVPTEAAIDGIGGTSFHLVAKADHISIPDGGSPLIWGYADGSTARAQYPGPTLIVNQGDTITVSLSNELDMPVSIVFPGHQVEAIGGSAGILTREAAPGGADNVVYTFTATDAGTYLYHSGTSPELQVEMGLVGAIVVRPSGFDPGAPSAYPTADSAYDFEYLFLLTEMDSNVHDIVEFEGVAALQATDYLSDYFPNMWFINGRAAPDTMLEAYVPWLPTQPYNCMPRMHPGDWVLLRLVSAGRDLHPFHHHGNHSRVIAKDGRLLKTAGATTADLSRQVYTIKAIPGETVDALFTWTGARLGWDIYGNPAAGAEYIHDCVDGNGDGFDDSTSEYCPDHYKPLPVLLPEQQSLAFGGFYSGSPFMGVVGALPPGEGGLNPNGGYTYMWHSHSEKELVNNDIFPGGMMSMMVIEPPGVVIE